MFFLDEVLVDSDTQVLAAVYYLQCMAMNMVVGIQDLFLIQMTAFFGVKFHLPGFFPSFQR